MEKKKKEIRRVIEIPEDVTIEYKDMKMTAKGPKGEVTKKIGNPMIKIKIEDKRILLEPKKNNKNQKRKIGTFSAHIKNLIKGVKEGYVYKLKVCTGHFPMNVGVRGDLFEVKNFLGEKNPRVHKIKGGAIVKVEGDAVVVESVDKETAGQTAASIEQLCRITNKDRRIFQDGIYIIEKAGKKI